MKEFVLTLQMLLLTLFLHAGSPENLNPDSLLIDLEILTTSVKENHPVMPAYLSADSFDILSNQIKDRIIEGITLGQFHSELNRLLSRIGCAHTYVYPLEGTYDKKKIIPNDLPFEIKIIDYGIYVSKSLKKEYDSFVGQRIQSVNGISADSILTSALDGICSDGHNLTFKFYHFCNKFMYYLQEEFHNPDSLIFLISDQTLTVRCPTGYEKVVSDDEEPFFRELEGVPLTVLLTIPGFDEGKSVLKKCFKYLKKNKIQNLIIDLRNNPGGNGNIGSYLCANIIDSTTTYYLDQKTNPLRYKEYFGGRQGLLISNQYVQGGDSLKSYYFTTNSEKENNYDGNVFVLVNGGTLSTAAYVSSNLKHKNNSIFIGEETGGSEFAIGAGIISKLTLPYSQLMVKFPMLKWRFNGTPEDKGTGVIPDHIVIPEPDDLKRGRDLELEMAKNLILRSKSLQ